MIFNVTVHPSGHQFTVDENEIVLDAAMRQNIGLPYGCRGGRCGACSATLVSGEMVYPGGPPAALEAAGPGKCLPCQGLAVTDLVLEIREADGPADIEVRQLPCRVQRIEHLAHDVIRLYLKLPDNQRMMFHAGQYLDFLLPDGRRRAFSIANAPHDDEFIELHIRHVDGGAFTDWAFTQMHERAILRIEGPHGSFTLDESSSRPLLFLAGGTGFAPIKAQIEHAFASGIERPMTLYWGVRSRRDLYLPELPQHWVDAHPAFRFVPVLSEPDDDWLGRDGFVHEAVLAEIADLPGYDIYMAGPPVMVVAARDALRAAGVPDGQMFYDSFEYAADTRDDRR